LQKLQHRPNTNIASDKDRMAMTRHPELDIKELRKILATPARRERRVRVRPRRRRPHNPLPAFRKTNHRLRSKRRIPRSAQLQTPATPNISNEFKKYAGSMSAGSAIARGDPRGGCRARCRPAGGRRQFWLRVPGAHGRQMGNLEVLSDTMGVDFGPYLQRVLHDVRENWYNAIPESAQMKHGNLIIEFAITKDGQVAGMKLVTTSGDSPLDRAAWAGITGSDPFPPLPSRIWRTISRSPLPLLL
jgi:TonB family protein